jgi:broad specificity phosphatase PhoE
MTGRTIPRRYRWTRRRISVLPPGVRTLPLVCHAPTSATRKSVFPGDESLDDRARKQAAQRAGFLPERAEAISSSAVRCRQTATAAGLDPQVEPQIAECDFGSWSGRTLVDLDEIDPHAVREWMIDPEARPHGGESLCLGGPFAYDGRVEVRPWLGDGSPPGVTDVRRTVRLSLAVGAASAAVCAIARSAAQRSGR